MTRIFTLLLMQSLVILVIAQNRSYDGSQNNLSNTEWGAFEGDIERVVTNGYNDLISEPGMPGYPNPRLISTTIYEQTTSIPNASNISDYGWAFGQLLDHDVTLVDDMPGEFVNIPIPAGDPFFDPTGTGTQEIFMRRSKYHLNTGTALGNPRVHMNDVTAWIDASNVYGSDEERALWLRTMQDGKLKTSFGNLLPFNTVNGELDGAIDTTAPFMLIEGVLLEKFFVAGDIRANEQPILTSLHTLFVREHNRLCDEIIVENPTWTDEEIYQKARKMVGAFMQSIVYNEWLPTLGIEVTPYAGYDSGINPNIMNVFSAAAFRLGHTLLNEDLLRLDNNGVLVSEGMLNLKDAFFNPFIVRDEGGIEPLLKGMAAQRQQTFDTKVVGDLRNFLFGPPGAGGLDLVAININRGRERGLPDFNTIKADFGLPMATSFADITSDPELQNQLSSLYPDVNSIDPWVGMLSEDHQDGAAIGTTIAHILQRQFLDLRDGDRFYYENDPGLTAEEIALISNTTMSQIIKRNSTITVLQEDVFHAKSHSEILSIPAVSAASYNLRFFPNPAVDELAISLNIPVATNALIMVYDMTGRKVMVTPTSFSKGEQQVSLNVHGLKAGIYQVVIEMNGDAMTQRFVKN